MPDFAETLVEYPDGQVNVNQPPHSVLANGFIPETSGARGMPLPAQWLNWCIRVIFRYINRDKVTDANGVGLFPYKNSLIRLEAIDAADTNKYIIASGYKGSSGIHSLRVLSNSVLTLGAPTVDGNQPVIRRSAVKRVGYS